MSAETMSTNKTAYIGCWFNKDMYAHNCSDMVHALRRCGVNIDVITSNCRCFSTAQRFDIAEDELIDINCTAIKIPHAPRNPGKKKHGIFKYLLVKALRLDIWLSIVRGFLYYWRSRRADVIHYDQVLEAFGPIPLFVLAMLAGVSRKRLIVTVHEIDPCQRKHKWINRLYRRCTQVLVYSEDMKRSVVALGVEPAKVRVTRYGAGMADLKQAQRTGYIYFGGHFIMNGKGYPDLIGALEILKSREIKIQLLIYVGHGCNGLEEAREMAVRAGVDDFIRWEEFFCGEELEGAYQSCKACIIPFTKGSARHPVTSAMTNATAVIATRCVDIPEYLGTLGIYIDGSSASIADAICDIEDQKVDVTKLGTALREKAMNELDFMRIAQELYEIYI
jgi:glycosyltransferase involved in cell wall biosynthesis